MNGTRTPRKKTALRREAVVADDGGDSDGSEGITFTASPENDDLESLDKPGSIDSSRSSLNGSLKDSVGRGSKKSKAKKNKQNFSMSKNLSPAKNKGETGDYNSALNGSADSQSASNRKRQASSVKNHFTGGGGNNDLRCTDDLNTDASSQDGSVDSTTAKQARAKTAKANAARSSMNKASPDQVSAMKSNGQMLDPKDASRQKNGSGGTTPRSRGSDGSDTDKRVSFRENLEDHSDGMEPPRDNASESRERTNSLTKKMGGSRTASVERLGPISARDPPKDSPLATREPPMTAREFNDSPKVNGTGGPPWRKVSSEPIFPKSARDQMKDADAYSEDISWERTERYGSGRDGHEYEPSGRKFTKKVGKANFGSSTTLSSNTENSEDGDDVFNVVLRVRPLNPNEKSRRDKFVADFPGDGQVSVNNQGTVRSFQFNVVFEPDAAQEDIFENSGMKKLVEAALNGFSCTAFAFGQTGSGKTHTMTGPPAQSEGTMEFHTEGVTPDPKMYGIMQRSFKYLFQQIKKQGTPKIIRASYLEIYNEQVIDLLNNSHRRYLMVRWSKNKGFYVENLFTVECETIDDLMAVLEEGLRNRQTGSHGLNEFSSRSHSVLTVTVDSETQPEPEDENLYITKRGKLSFVDLAGSEKVKDSNAPGGPGMVESNSINKSLLVLGNCISHLGDSKRRQGHIPYRDSKLTKLLADSLGGNGITLMIACITPSSSNVTETMNTLRYASRAKKIKTRPTVKMDPREKLIVTLKKEIKILRQENHYLRQQLDFPAKPKGQLQKENDEKFMKFMKEQQQKESGLYEMLQEYMVENEALRAENSEMISAKDSTRREQQILYKENEKLSKRVEELERLISEHPGTWGLMDHRRTDGYGQQDLSPRGSPVTVGYMSPSHKTGVRPTDLPIGGNRNKVASPVSHGQPLRPPHRLPDHVTRPLPRPVDYVEDGGYANGYMSPRQQSLVKQGVASPRQLDRKASQVSQSDVIRDMNEKLKKDVMQLDGEIQQHARIAHTSQNMKQNYYR